MLCSQSTSSIRYSSLMFSGSRRRGSRQLCAKKMSATGLRLASTKPSTTATLLAIAVRRFPLPRSIDPSCWSTTTTTTTTPTTTIRLQAFVTPVRGSEYAQQILARLLSHWLTDLEIGNHSRGTLPYDGHNPGKTLHSDYGRYEIHPRCRRDCGTDTTATTGDTHNHAQGRRLESMPPFVH
uniref:Uncharacterized protein n=1 Tax=Anopheles merus TaxID=30066 RepID=A0A182VN98_ANOME